MESHHWRDKPLPDDLHVLINELLPGESDKEFGEEWPTLRTHLSLIISVKLCVLSKPISALMFPNPKGQAWLKHAIEEMGSLENFLPQLYEREVGRSR